MCSATTMLLCWRHINGDIADDDDLGQLSEVCDNVSGLKKWKFPLAPNCVLQKTFLSKESNSWSIFTSSEEENK